VVLTGAGQLPKPLEHNKLHASAGSRAAGTEAQTPRLAGAYGRQARGFRRVALRAWPVVFAPKTIQQNNKLIFLVVLVVLTSVNPQHPLIAD
jgi:hypothetical protein